jgi:hypothetical protein
MQRCCSEPTRLPSHSAYAVPASQQTPRCGCRAIEIQCGMITTLSSATLSTGLAVLGPAHCMLPAACAYSHQVLTHMLQCSSCVIVASSCVLAAGT